MYRKARRETLGPVGGFPRGPGMERKEVMGKNVAIYKGQASALEEHANPGCKAGLVSCPFRFRFRFRFLSFVH